MHLDKPVYVGMTILDLSNYHMYDFYYNHLKNIYGDGITFLYADTDSMIIQLYTDDVSQNMANI